MVLFMNGNVLPTRLLAIMYGSFLLMGVVMGMTGPLVPFFRSDLGLTYGEAGLLFSAQSVGSLVLLAAGGWVSLRIGTKWLLFLGATLFSLGMAVVGLAPGFVGILVGNVLVGTGMSAMDIGVSTLCIEANPEGKGKALNRLHFFFGAGAVLGPLVALALGHLPSGWRLAYLLVAVGPLAAVLTIPSIRVPRSQSAVTGQKWEVYKSPFLWFGALCLFVYCGVEWGVGAWFPSYWKAIPGAENLDPALATSLFWVTFAVGRFTVGSWADAWGFQKFLTLALGSTLAVTGLWILFPQPVASMVWILLFGFLIAGMYPTFAAFIAHRFPGSAPQVTSFLSLFASMGTFFWPPLVGAWADDRGISILPVAQFIMTLLLAGAAAAAFASGRKNRG